jgi:hypothetical protein
MELNKLKLDKFHNIRFVNFPREMLLGHESTEKNAEVIIYYINSPEDVNTFVDLCNSSNLPKDNRTIMIYKKGRKDGVNRDSIFMPFKENKHKGFILKAPMLCSISNELSACVLSKQ